MNRQSIWIVAILGTILCGVLLGIEGIRIVVLTWLYELFELIKHNIVALLAAFFLVKGKFVMMAFLKKVALLTATGLSKRYFIEKIITHNLKIHFWDYISDDFKRLAHYVRHHFKDFPIIKQIIAGVTFLGSLGFVGKFMGGMLAMKIFIAKFWSFILAIVLKSSAAILYFFTDYLWGSWIAPVVEVLLLSWVFEWLEKVPFVERYSTRVYQFFIGLFRVVGRVVQKVFHLPMKHFLKVLAGIIKRLIHSFVGGENTSVYQKLQEIKTLNPNRRTLLQTKRETYKKQKRAKHYSNSHQKLLEQRATKSKKN